MFGKPEISLVIPYVCWSMLMYPQQKNVIPAVRPAIMRRGFFSFSTVASLNENRARGQLHKHGGETHVS